MALKENYKDDILDVSVNTKRKYRMTENQDGTVSLDDETVYTQEGDSFGASDMNATNGKVNALETDIGEIDDSLTDGIGGTTDKFRFGTDGNGNYGYIKEVEGADTFFPFSSGIKYTRIAKNITTSNTPSARTYTFTEDGEYLIIAFHGNSGGRALTLSLDTTNVQQTLFNTENFYEGSSADSRCVTCLKIVKAKNGDSITVNSSSPGGTTNAGYIVYKLKGFNFNTITKITAVGQENVVNNSIPISSKGKYLTVFTSTNALIKNYVTEDTIMFIREFIIDANNQPVSFIIAISEQEDNSSIPMVTVDRLSLGYYGYSYYLGQIQ